MHLCCSPLYHTAVLNFATISVQLGHPVVLMDRFEPEELPRDPNGKLYKRRLRDPYWQGRDRSI